MELGIMGNYDEQNFKYAKELGLTFIELCWNIGNTAEELWAQLDNFKANTAKYGVRIGAVGRWGTDKFDEKGEVIAEELEQLHSIIDFCNEVGVDNFNVGVNYVESLTKYENLVKTVDYLSALVEYGKTKGVRIATINCDWNNYILGAEQWEYIHGQIKELGIKFDPSHSINGGRDYLKEIAEWGTRFHHIHVKGTLNINGNHVDDPPAGLDMINWYAVMGLLYAAGYNGTLSIEPHSHTWRGDIGDFGVRRTVDFIKPLIYFE